MKSGVQGGAGAAQTFGSQLFLSASLGVRLALASEGSQLLPIMQASPLTASSHV